MSKRGKHLQIGAGSRSRSTAKAEDKARRSRKRAAARWIETPGGVAEALNRYDRIYNN